jgi:hypothetical protein
MTEHTCDVVIVGCGAAGLMAAIAAGRQAPPGSRIIALDGATTLGAKILVAGGGRCNVTHDVVTPDDFSGSSRPQIAKVLRTFTVPQTVDFFSQLGVQLKREQTGKLFPVSDSAQTVLDALLHGVRNAHVELRTDHRVSAIEHIDDAFRITTNHGLFIARTLILATGGKSLPKTGSDGAGYDFARTLGHSVTPTTPALVPLLLPTGHWLTELSGVAVEAELTVHSPSGKALHRQRGAMLLTHFGLSGPAVLDISRHWIAAHTADPAAHLTAHLVPQLQFKDLEEHAIRAAAATAKLTVGSFVRRWLPVRLADALLQQGLGIDRNQPMGHLSRDSRRKLIHGLTALPLPVLRDRGYLFAEVTAGGIPLSEVDVATMASRRQPGLLLCGEILDVDGRIGGYNFQWAWCTGRLAGQTAARQCLAHAKSADIR